MKSARPRKTDGVRGFQRRETVAQQRPRMIEREVLLVSFGANTNPLREHPLKMRGAHGHARSQCVKRQRCLGGIDLFDGAADHVIVVFLII